MKIIILVLILSIITSCKDKDSNMMVNRNKVNLKNIVQNIEKNQIFFNKTIECVGIIERLNAFEIIFDSLFNNTSYCFYYDVDSSSFDDIYKSDSIYYKNNKELIIRYADSIFTICKELNLQWFDIHPYKPHKDSSVFEFSTCYFDSTYKDLKAADSSYYDRYYELNEKLDENEVFKSTDYYYTLIYIPVDTVKSDYFKFIKNYHKINKINKNWYYYRENRGIILTFRNFKEKALGKYRDK
ncbi:MAG TPA: hypothetical protein PLE30_10960 [Candidatus Kapabacteria bacterium]|nr:hypothetical protein [Candidatus Kapabacteria bacterium]